MSTLEQRMRIVATDLLLLRQPAMLEHECLCSSLAPDDGPRSVRFNGCFGEIIMELNDRDYRCIEAEH